MRQNHLARVVPPQVEPATVTNFLGSNWVNQRPIHCHCHPQHPHQLLGLSYFSPRLSPQRFQETPRNDVSFTASRFARSPSSLVDPSPASGNLSSLKRGNKSLLCEML